MQKSSPTKTLGSEAEAWRSAILAEIGGLDQAGQLLLQSALEAFQRSQAAEAILDRDGLVFEDRFGQTKPHPAATIARLERESMVRALRALGLEVEPALAPGRPPGSARKI